MRKMTALMTGLVLLLAMAAIAQASAKATAAKEHKAKAEVTRQASGTITSTDANTLVLSHKVNGKEQQTTFTLNDQTRKQGELRSGEKATVHYKVEGDQNIATMVKAKGGTMTAATSRTHKK